MSPGAFNYHALRARKARLGRLLGGRVVRAGLVLLALLAIAVLVYGLLQGQAIAWLTLVVLGPLLVTLGWYEYELKNIPPSRRAQSIDDLLESPLLALLPEAPSPKSIAEVTMRTSGGHFYAARFGIGPNMLGELLSSEPADAESIWQTAVQLHAQSGASVMTSATVVAALIDTCPNIDTILAHLQLDKTDIMSGIDWQQHIAELVEKHGRKSRAGFGRDWSFGYTPLLSRFGVNISEQIERRGLLVREIEGHQSVLDQMIEALTSGHQNAALVGPLGVGKTTLVEALAERLLQPNAPSALRFHQVVRLDASTLIGNASGRGQLEQLIPELLYEAHSAKNIILCLDDAELFFEEGVGSVDLSNILQPVLDGGGLRMIITIDEQRLLQIGQRNPGLLRSLNRISVTSPDKRDVLHVLQDQLILFEFQSKVTYMYQALLESYRLGERYVHEVAMPGKALKLLEAAARYHENGLVTARSVQAAVEQTEGVKVSLASSEDERQTLLNLEQKIHERMINQTRAVQVVSDALRRARAGVRNLERPIGTFLFLGPTGVGKTELAKSIGAIYFGGEDRLIRLDLNEFNQPTDVARLIAAPGEDPNSLTAQVRKNPFSVVLLDEIEKAAPEVLNTLLQLLDEGILRDSTNQEISFRDAIIIATSNAGADRIRAHIEAGEQLEQFESQFLDELIDSNIFRPEFLNRFDETVLFRPLNQTELLQVVDLIIAGINRNLALQKIAVHVADDAKILMVQRGYDPRLGARPMRRIVQRSVENLVSRAMLSGQLPPGATMEITAQDVAAILGEIQPPAAQSPTPPANNLV